MVGIVDSRGNPIQTKELTEPQTARVASLYREYGNHPVRGLTPGRLASILEDAERGNLKDQADLFEDMEEKDAHIMAEMGKRKRALLGLEWDIKPPRNASKEEEDSAAFVKEVIQDIQNFEDVILDMGDGIGKGYSCLEFDGWHRVENVWMPVDILHRPPSWFTVDRETHSELRLRDNTGNGEVLQPFGWIVHIHKAKSGYVTRGGLHRVLAWPFLFKNYSVRDLAEFLEIYGLPLRLGEYPTGATDKEKATLMSAVMNIGHAAAGIIPQGMAIDFKEAATGNKDPFEAMIQWCEDSQSKAILGGTLTTTADNTGLGSSQADVHNEVRHDLMVADAVQVGSTLTRDLVYPILALSKYAPESIRRCPRFVFDTREPEDMKLYSDALPKLVDIGMQIPADWAHDKLRIPEPDKDTTVLQRSQVQPAAPGGTPLSALPTCPHCNNGIAALKTSQANDVADHYSSQLDNATVDAMNALIEPVRQLVLQANSLEEVRDGLAMLFTDMDETVQADILQKALAAAELAGRFEVNEGK